MPLKGLATLCALGVSLCLRPLWPDYFAPDHRLPGIGASRRDLTDEVLARRTEAMIQSQTFIIMREPQALPGARRIYSSSLQHLFREAERRSGFPASVLQAIAYLESWGNPTAQSPAGPRGIMQISESTGRSMGLRISYAVRHRVIKTRTVARNKRGKLVYRTVRQKQAYTVLLRDDRLRPDRAIPAAAMYLERLQQRFGGIDWAIWAYHCGEGCVSDFVAMARETEGLSSPPAGVAKVFFNCSPVWNRPLYQAIHTQMDRDYSPTYWFRVMRAQQLLAIYQDDPTEFNDLVEEYRYKLSPAIRAPDRLSVWLRPQDLVFETYDAIRNAETGRLVKAPEDPDYFGYRVDMPAPLLDGDSAYLEAFPSTVGTLAYIAFETRKLLEVMLPGDPTFVPLEVTALLLPMKDPAHPANWQPGARTPEHASGQVFDIDVTGLPPAERECLQFVLDDLGWSGYLGFIEESPSRQVLHLGCSPASRDFFAQVYEDQLVALRNRTTPPVIPAAAPAPAIPGNR